MKIVVVNYKGLTVGAPLLPPEWMGLVLVLAKLRAYLIYNEL